MEQKRLPLHPLPLSAQSIPRTEALLSSNFWDQHNKCSRYGTAAMRGMTLNIPLWNKWLPLAVSAGKVTQLVADKVLDGITHGFDLGIQEDKMGSAKVRKNYSSALDNASMVSDALRKRVIAGKSLKLGKWDPSVGFPTGVSGCNVPQGAVAKKMQPDIMRPVSDHTKTLFNDCCDTSEFVHTLDTYAEIARELKPNYFMRVEDVDGAFPVLPLAPKVWKYMYVIWYDVDKPLSEQSSPNTLYTHVFGDFGTAAMPGVWDMFWRCVKAMAEVAGVQRHPMPHFVDDNSIIGPSAAAVDAEAKDLGRFVAELGVPFKDMKSREAAMKQLVLGFWWDSTKRTRTLEVEKLQIYLDHLDRAISAKWLSLKDLQVLAGRMQRAAMTMPPRAIVYLGELLRLMSGLKYPWHRKRVTAAVRRDLRMLHSTLLANQGRGYFCFKHFKRAPAVYTDASKDARFAGGGFFSECGAYDYWQFGSSQSRQPIDFLEGAAVLRAAEALGPKWKNKIVPIFIDNSAFCGSLRKGRSKAPRLNLILEQLFRLSVQYDCVFEPHWISTHDNIAADALSRWQLSRFKDYVSEHFAGVLDLHRVGE